MSNPNTRYAPHDQQPESYVANALQRIEGKVDKIDTKFDDFHVDVSTRLVLLEKTQSDEAKGYEKAAVAKAATGRGILLALLAWLLGWFTPHAEQHATQLLLALKKH